MEEAEFPILTLVKVEHYRANEAPFETNISNSMKFKRMEHEIIRLHIYLCFSTHQCYFILQIWIEFRTQLALVNDFFLCKNLIINVTVYIRMNVLLIKEEDLETFFSQNYFVMLRWILGWKHTSITSKNVSLLPGKSFANRWGCGIVGPPQAQIATLRGKNWSIIVSHLNFG